jgi:hypothetical protein
VLRRFLAVNLDGRVRTHPKTQPAPRTATLIDQFRIRVALFIEDIGHTDIAARTKNHTHPAALAAVYVKFNISHTLALSQNPKKYHTPAPRQRQINKYAIKINKKSTTT